VASDWSAWASVVATALGTAGVISQVQIQRHQRLLQEAQAYHQQASAWSTLGADWQRCVLAATGPIGAVRHGVSKTRARDFEIALIRFRDAEVAWLDILSAFDSSGDFSRNFQRAEADHEAAKEGLAAYQQSVQRIVSHLAQTASLVLSGKLSIEVAYDTMGPQLLRIGEDLRNVLSLRYDHGSSCVAPGNQERALWRGLPPDAVNRRYGWGGFLDIAQGTAERVGLLIDLLAIHGMKVGDLATPRYPHEDLHAAETLSQPDRLALSWRAARSTGKFRAVLLVHKLASVGRSYRRRYATIYPKRYLKLWRRWKGEWEPVPFNGWVLAPRDLAASWLDTARAMKRAKSVPDLRRAEAPHLAEQRLNYFREENSPTNV